MTGALLVLDRLTKRFGEQEAVSGLSLEIARGEFIALMGPSGCGKTTTLRMIAGLEEPSEGEIRFEGARVNERKPWERDTPMGVAEPRALPLFERPQECRIRPQDAQGLGQGAPAAGDEMARSGGHRALRQPEHRAAFGR